MRCSYYMKILWRLVFILALSTDSFAGLKWVDVGVNGLTCSMCSRSVEMSLRKLNFVDSVVMNLETTEGRIYFSKDAPVNFNAIARAVVNAGFSVRFVKLQMAFDDVAIDSEGSFKFQGQQFRWLGFQQVKGTVGLTLVDEKFLPKKDFAEVRKKYITVKEDGQSILHVVQS